MKPLPNEFAPYFQKYIDEVSKMEGKTIFDMVGIKAKISINNVYIGVNW